MTQDLGERLGVAAAGHGLSGYELANARGAHGDKGVRRRGLHLREQREALREVALGEGGREIPRLHLRCARHEPAHIPLGHGIGAAPGKRDLLELVVEMHGVLADKLYKSACRPPGEHDTVAGGHGAHPLRQLPALRRGAVDDGLGAEGRDGLVQTRVLCELLGLQGEHCGIARRAEISHDLLGVGLLQLLGVAYVHETHRAGEGHGIAGVGDVGTGGRLAVEVVGVEGEVTELGQARPQPCDDGLALEGILANGKICRQQLVLLLIVCHRPIVPDQDADASFWLRTVSFSMENATLTSPRSSLQSTSAPAAARVSHTAGAGWP